MMDYSYYDEDEEERQWGPRPTPRERMQVQRAMGLGRGGRGRGRGGSDSRSTTPPGSRLRMARSSRDVSEEAESDFSSSPSRRILRVRQRGSKVGANVFHI